MKTGRILGFLSVLLCSSTVFAVNGSAYYNLYKATGTMQGLLLKQENAACSGCIASKKDTPANLKTLLNDNWKSGQLHLGSDIDLGGFNIQSFGKPATPAGECDVNHVPLTYPDGALFMGENKTIKHLCYSGKATGPIGLFASGSGGTFNDLKISGVRIYIDGTSTNGEDYHPVGTLFGEVSQITIQNITIANDSINAPFAGGVVGHLNNATLKNVKGDDDIYIFNTAEITNGYAGSKYVESSYGHNVFLGGLVGYVTRPRQPKANASMENDSIKVDVHDFAKGNNSAVGGLVGVVSSADDIFKNVHVYTKKKINETVPSRISGGSSMGGLVGFVGVHYELNSQQEGTVTLDNTSFEGEIGGAFAAGALVNGVKNNVISVGGLVGQDSTVGSAALKIVDSKAVVTIKDSLTVADTYRYSVGGILGSSSACMNGIDEFAYVSIMNTRAGGSIDIAGSNTAVKGLHIRTFAGGIAGRACLATTANNLKGDSSSVLINLRTKTGNSTVNGAIVFDTVAVGGLFGIVDNATEKVLSVSQVGFTGSLTVADSLNSVLAGGLLGAYREASGGKTIAFKNVSVISPQNIVNHLPVKVASITKGYNDKQTAKIGGLCGYCRELSLVDQAEVRGSVETSKDYEGDSLFVGGLVGEIDNNDVDMRLAVASVVGDLIISKTRENVLAGYVAGDVTTSKDYAVASIYHFSEKDAVGPFGKLFKGSGGQGADTTEEGWENNENIRFVVRNGETTNITNDPCYNGVETAANMKSSAFAARLNTPLSSPYPWAYDTRESDLPFLSYDIYSGVSPANKETYAVAFYDFDNRVIGKFTVDKGAAAIPPEEPSNDSCSFDGWDADFSDVQGTLDVKAKCKVNTFTVLFLTDSITKRQIGVWSDKPYGYSVVSPNPQNVPEKEGMHFVGWSTDAYMHLVSDLEVYPVYVPDTIRVVYRNFDGEQLDEKNLAYGGTYEFPMRVPTRVDADGFSYTFAKWVMEDGSDIPEVIPAYDHVLVAVYDSVLAGQSSSSIPPESSGSAYVIVKSVPKVIGGSVQQTYSVDNLDKSQKTEFYLAIFNSKGEKLDSSVVNSDYAWSYVAPYPGKYFTKLYMFIDGVESAVEVDSFAVKKEFEYDVQSWNMVSLAALKQEKIEFDDDAVFYWWDESNAIGEYWQYRSYKGGDVKPTQGFWYGTKAGSPLVLTSYSVDTDAEIVWELDNVYSGWNLVANPYNWAVDISKGIADDADAQVRIWSRNDKGGYDPDVKVIGPYEAVWVKTDRLTKFRIPATPFFEEDSTPISKKRAAFRKSARKAAAMGWSLGITLSDNYGKADSWNVIGVGSAVETVSEPPTAMGDRVTLAIMDGKNALAKSVKTVADEYEWTLSVSASNSRNGKISFDGVEDLNAMGLRLFATIDGKTTEVKAGEALDVKLTSSAKKVDVRVASAPKTVALASKISGLRMAQSAGNLHMQFETTADLAGSNAHYALVGVNGKKVASGSFTANGGNNSLTVAAPKTGVYFLQLKVGSQMNSAKVMVK